MSEELETSVTLLKKDQAINRVFRDAPLTAADTEAFWARAGEIQSCDEDRRPPHEMDGTGEENGATYERNQRAALVFDRYNRQVYWGLRGDQSSRTPGPIFSLAGMNAGHFRQLAQESLTAKDEVSDVLFGKFILYPLLTSYRANGNRVYYPHFFYEITRKELAAIDEMNNETVAFVLNAQATRPSVFYEQEAGALYALGKCLEVGAPGRVTDDHAKLVKLYTSLTAVPKKNWNVAYAWAQARNLIAGENWGGHLDLAGHLEQTVGFASLFATAKELSGVFLLEDKILPLALGRKPVPPMNPPMDQRCKIKLVA